MPIGIPIALMVLGLAIASIPLVMDLMYQATVHDEISHVEGTWSAADDREAEKVWKQARAYNNVLAGRPAGNGVKKVKPYADQLVYNAWPYICYLRIEQLGIELPVYHGTSEEALSSGAGHLEGTSLPVGGKDTNCCISAHSGIASSRMFDGLRSAQEGNLVELRTLGRSLWYRVGKVKIVVPEDNSPLGLAKGHDRLTLITCTSEPQPGQPRGGYGVNDRRLVVVCERCAAPKPGEVPQAPAVQVDERSLWPLLAMAAIVAVVTVSWAAARHRRKKRVETVYGPWRQGSKELKMVQKATTKALEKRGEGKR